VYCCSVPSGTDIFAGVTAIETNCADVTVSVVLPLIDPSVALILVLPTATPVASPPDEIVATPVMDDVQVTWLVRICVLPSL
jgi:hypothetical protein